MPKDEGKTPDKVRASGRIPFSPFRPATGLEVLKKIYGSTHAPLAPPPRRSRSVAKSRIAPSPVIDQPPGELVGIADTGMVDEHALSIQGFSSDNGVVIVFRPINSEAKGRLSNADQLRAYLAKHLNIKSKSSEFGPIAGDIPYYIRLNKSGHTMDDAEAKKEQAKLDVQLETDKELLNWYLQHPLTEDERERINAELLVVAVDKKHGEDTVCYAVDGDGHIILRSDTNEPIFAITRGERRLYYDGKEFVELEENAEKAGEFYFKGDPSKKSVGIDPSKIAGLEAVKILAYVKFGKHGEREDLPITADYDELSSAPLRLFPFEKEDHVPLSSFEKEGHVEKAVFTKTDCAELLADGPKELDMAAMRPLARSLVQYEESLRRQHWKFEDYPEAYKYMGTANADQWAGKIFLRDETDEAINHGPESNNPWPQPLTPGNYIAYLPDGRILCLRNEREICDFFNWARRHGYPIDVNPRWGWIMTPEGQLDIPPRKFDWSEVKKSLEVLRHEVAAAEERVRSLMEGRSIPYTADSLKTFSQVDLEKMFEEKNIEYSEENIRLLENERYDDLRSRLGDKVKLDPLWKDLVVIGLAVRKARNLQQHHLYEELSVELQTRIERLKLGADVVYGSPAGRYAEVFKKDAEMEKVDPEKLERLSKLIHDGERESRAKEMAKLETKLAQVERERKPEWGKSIIARERERFLGEAAGESERRIMVEASSSGAGGPSA